MDDKKRVVILNPQRMAQAEFARQDWVVNAEEGTKIEDVLDPQYWSHMSAQFKPYDHIEVRLDTGEWMLELLVLGCDRNWARVHVMHKHDLQPIEETMPSAIKHKVMWRGPQHKHCVVRIADGEVLQTGFDNSGAAREWAASHEHMIATT